MTAKEKKKKKPPRSSVKYPSLVPRYNSRIRQEYLDADYLDKLDDTIKNVKLPDGTMVTQLGYYAVFMSEWNNAGVGSQKRPKQNKLHRTKKEVKDCTDRNNIRNNDVYGIAKKDGKTFKVDYETLKEYIEKKQIYTVNNVENAFIDYLDEKRPKDEFLDLLESENLDDSADDTNDQGD